MTVESKLTSEAICPVASASYRPRSVSRLPAKTHVRGGMGAPVSRSRISRSTGTLTASPPSPAHSTPMRSGGPSGGRNAPAASPPPHRLARLESQQQERRVDVAGPGPRPHDRLVVGRPGDDGDELQRRVDDHLLGLDEHPPPVQIRRDVREPHDLRLGRRGDQREQEEKHDASLPGLPGSRGACPARPASVIPRCPTRGAGPAAT